MRKFSLIALAAALSACSPAESPHEATGQAQVLHCAKDTDCKGDRICDDGICKNPSSASQETTVASLSNSPPAATPLAADNTPPKNTSSEQAQADAGLPGMMKIYNNPELAPQVQGCKGDIRCNAFIALANHWQSIPDSYRYRGEYDVKASAKKGVTYDDQGRNIGLHSGFYFKTERSQELIDGVDVYVETEKHTPWNHEGGLAVLLYIEDKNGWATE